MVVAVLAVLVAATMAKEAMSTPGISTAAALVNLEQLQALFLRQSKGKRCSVA
jgi:uncharacterized membrane protein